MRHITRWSLIITLAFYFLNAVLSSDTSAKISAIKPSRYEKFALLVGVNEYKFVPKLRGSINDVTGLKKILVQRYGFKDSNILTLTNTDANKANILKVLKTHLLENARLNPNAEIYFHFSGYGTAKPNPNPLKPGDADAILEKLNSKGTSEAGGNLYGRELIRVEPPLKYGFLLASDSAPNKQASLLSEAEILEVIGEIGKFTPNVTVSTDASYSPLQIETTSVQISPDGSRLALKRSDFPDEIRLWDIAAGRQIGTINQPGIISKTFSQNGEILVTGHIDGKVKLWNVAAGKELKSFQAHSAAVKMVLLFNSGNEPGMLLSVAAYGTIKIWDITKEQELKTWNITKERDLKTFTSDATINCIMFSSASQILTMGSNSGVIKFWNAVTGREFEASTSHSTRITSLDFSPDGKTLASGSEDKTVKLWNAQTGQELKTFTGHTSGIVSLAFSPDRKTLATGDSSGKIKLWNIASGQELKTLNGDDYSPFEIIFSQDSKTLVSGTDTVKIWDIDTGKELKSFDSSYFHFNSGNNRLLIVDMNNSVSQIDIKSLKVTQLLSTSKDVIRFVPYAVKDAESKPKKAAGGESGEQKNSSSGEETAERESDKITLPKNYIRIQGGGSFESSDTSGNVNGYLTSKLVEALGKLPSYSTYDSLGQEIYPFSLGTGNAEYSKGLESRFRAMEELNKIIFDSDFLYKRFSMSADLPGGDKAKLKAGGLQGIRKNDRVLIFDDDKFVEGKVSASGFSSSEIDLKSPTLKSDYKNATVYLIGERNVGALKILLDDSIQDKELRTELGSKIKVKFDEAELSLLEQEIAGTSRDYVLAKGKFGNVFGGQLLAQKDENGEEIAPPEYEQNVYYLKDDLNKPVFGFYLTENSSNLAERFVKVFQKLIKLREIYRQGSSSNDINEKFRIKIFQVTGSTDESGNLIIEKETEISPAEGAGIPFHLETGKAIRFQAENLTDEDRYLSAFWIGTDGAISAYTSSDIKIDKKSVWRSDVVSVPNLAGIASLGINFSKESIYLGSIIQDEIGDGYRAEFFDKIRELSDRQKTQSSNPVSYIQTDYRNRDINTSFYEKESVLLNFSFEKKSSRDSISYIEDQTIKFWNAETGKTSFPSISGLGTVKCLALSTNGIMAAGNQNGEIFIGSASARDLNLVQKTSSAVKKLTFSPDNTMLASSHENGKVYLWKASGEKFLNTRGTEQFIAEGDSMSFSADNFQIITVKNKQINLWYIGNNLPIQVIDSKHEDEITDVIYTKDKKIITSSLDGAIRIGQFVVNGYEYLKSFSPQEALASAKENERENNYSNPVAEAYKGVTAIALSKNGQDLAAGYENGAVKVWNISNGGSRDISDNHSTVSFVSFSDDGQILASGNENGNLGFWNLKTNSETKSEKAHLFQATAGFFDNNSKTFVSAGSRKSLKSNKPRLFVLSIGINSYKDRNLLSAENDASVFSFLIEKVAENKFLQVKKIDLPKNKKDYVSRKDISDAFERVIKESTPADTFVFFYSGVGDVLPESDNPKNIKFAIVTSENEVISEAEMWEWMERIPAKNQLIIADTCNSAELVSTFNKPLPKTPKKYGYIPNKDVNQALKRKRTIIGIEGDATDNVINDHGQLTYSALLGLLNRADAGIGDGQITAKGLEAYIYRVYDEVPNQRGGETKLSSYSTGGDFSIGSAKNEPEEVYRSSNTGKNKIASRKKKLSDSDLGRKYALIVAVKDYEDNNTWKNLSNPVRDAEAVSKELAEKYGFEVEILCNPTVQEFAKKLEEYKERNYGDRGSFFFMFTGHGTYNMAEGYFAFKNSSGKDYYGGNYFTHSQLKNFILEEIHAPNILVVLDSCRSGAFAGADVTEKSKNKDSYSTKEEVIYSLLGTSEDNTRMFITAGGDRYEDVSDGKEIGHSPFTEQLLDALRKDGEYLTIGQIKPILTKVKSSTPKAGYFGENKTSREFVFFSSPRGKISSCSIKTKP